MVLVANSKTETLISNFCQIYEFSKLEFQLLL
jgi:hypothetical protein